jgi:hypothetical protein
MTVLQFPGHDDDEQQVPALAEPDPALLSPGYDDEGAPLPVMPSWLTDRDELASVVRYHAARHWHATAFHGIRAPQYAVTTLWWAFKGTGRLTSRLMRWWHWTDGWLLESMAVAAGRAGHADAMRAHTEGKKTRSRRGRIIGACAVLILGAILAGIIWVPWWGWLGLAAAAVIVLAYHGKPKGRPLVQAATVAPRYAPPTPAIIQHALGSLGIPGINAVLRDERDLTFVTDVHRDGEGWGCDLDLPHGVTSRMILARREQLASGLRRPLSATWPESVPHEHEGRLRLWIGYQDMAKVKPKPWPLLKAGQADIFASVPFGTDPRGRAVTAPLFEVNWLIGSAPGQGKALALDTPVPTPSGWTSMGELRDGDLVFGADGQPCKVQRAWAVRYDRPCYDVEFSDGTVITADADHLWFAETRRSRMSDGKRRHYQRSGWTAFSRDMEHRLARPGVVTTAEMAASLRVNADQRLNYSIPVAAPLHGEHADLLVPPYTLGAWLGDGTSAAGTITSIDREVIEEIRGEDETVSYRRYGAKAPTWNVRGLMPRLREIGVLGNKHIPVRYLRASEEQRRALLAGLLDTDGYCQGPGRGRIAGTVYFAVTSERLARDVHALVSTLGYKPSLNVKPVKLGGRDLGTQWLVTFTPADKVFRMQRKLQRQITTPRSSSGRRYITAIRPVHSVPVRCITVDSADHLYLVGRTCIPTHNTTTVRELACAAALDPVCDLWIHELAGKGDLEPLAQVCERYTSGLDDESVTYAANSVAKLRKELERRSTALKAIPKEQRPDGKVTRELAARRSLGLRPKVCIIDECQILFMHPELGKQAGDDAAYVIRLGRAYGIILILATQRPTGESLPTQISGNVAIRFCLRVAGHLENDIILGTGAHKSGYRATVFRAKTDAGLGWLRGDDDPQIVRTYYLDLPATGRVAARARAMREQAGVLSGYALGEEDDAERRRFAADVLAVFGADRNLWNDTIAERLSDRMPGVYADVTPGAVSDQLRAAGITVKQVRETGRGVRAGCERGALEHVLGREVPDGA